MSAVIELGREVGVKPACVALGVSRATVYRRRKQRRQGPRTVSPRALVDDERQQILDVLHSEPFHDLSVPEVYATLLGQGTYLASPSTMYRILRASS